MNTSTAPKPRCLLRLSAVGLAFGSVLACNAVLGIGEDELICLEGGCEDAGVFTGSARPTDPDDGEGRGAVGGDAPGDAGPQDGSFTPAPPTASETSELPTGSNAALPGGGGAQVDSDNSGPGSSGSGNDGNQGGAGNGGPSSDDDDDDDGDDDDGDDDDVPPPPPPSPCQGRASGEVFCSGTTRISCGPGGVVSQSLTCLTAEHCLQATGAACAVCLASEVRCDDDVLVSCNATRTGFDARSCASATLCSAATNECLAAACSAGQSRCRGANLERCNATQTGFEPVTSCGSPQACNAAAGTCDVCTPRASRCQNPSTIALCDASGQSESFVECGLLESCVNGDCVTVLLPLL